MAGALANRSLLCSVRTMTPGSSQPHSKAYGHALYYWRLRTRQTCRRHGVASLQDGCTARCAKVFYWLHAGWSMPNSLVTFWHKGRDFLTLSLVCMFAQPHLLVFVCANMCVGTGENEDSCVHACFRGHMNADMGFCGVACVQLQWQWCVWLSVYVRVYCHYSPSPCTCTSPPTFCQYNRCVPPQATKLAGGGFPLLLRHIPSSSTSDTDRTWDWRAAAPTLVVFKFVLAITYTMLQLDLAPGLPRTQHPYVPQHLPPTSLPTTSLYLIAIYFRYKHPDPGAPASSHWQQPLRTARPSTCTQTTLLTPANTQPWPPHPLATCTQESWLYSPLPLTKECSSVGRSQVPHRLASRWNPFCLLYQV